jgi:hypothetical protein
LKTEGLRNMFTANEEVTASELLFVVIPASKARRESLREDRKDSGQAGMTDKAHLKSIVFLQHLGLLCHAETM